MDSELDYGSGASWGDTGSGSSLLSHPECEFPLRGGVLGSALLAMGGCIDFNMTVHCAHTDRSTIWIEGGLEWQTPSSSF